MTSRSKALALASMWAGVGSSCVALAGMGATWQATTLALGITGTATVVFFVRTSPVGSYNAARVSAR